MPEPIMDLRAAQSGYKVTLSWTNPARYVDTNPATDLAIVRILQNGVEIAAVPVTGPGKPQSYEIDVTNALDDDVTFAVQVETERRRISPPANVALRPIDVPGPPRALRAVFDQYQIMLSWEPPERNANLVAVYVVQRANPPGSFPTKTTMFTDSDYEPGQIYTYTVAAARNPDGTTPGPAESIMVTAADETPPATPAGLEIQPMGTDAVLRWTANTERDLKEYLVFRSDRAEPMRSSVNGFADQNYMPGLSYQLAAVDYADNQSERSAPQAGP
jgi:hypothetical protein